MSKVIKFTKLQKAMIKVFERFREIFGIGFTWLLTGKMFGMLALSSSPIGNERCAKRHDEGNKECVCAECYSCAECAYRKGLKEKLERNGQILSAKIIPVKDWPKINPRAWKHIRIEAHGDTRNWIHAANYFNLAKRNLKNIFTAWTKNLDYYGKAIENGYEKPINFILIASSPILNTPMELGRYKDIVDYVFTVYTFEFIKANDIHPEFINCGARSCKKCLLCYTKHDGEPVYVNEILKKDAKKVYKWWKEKGYLVDEKAA